MEEINAWGAYESAATQNARSLGRDARRSSIKKKTPVDQYDESYATPHVRKSQSVHDFTNNLQGPGSRPNTCKSQSVHTLFFGTDDIPNIQPNKVKDTELGDVSKKLEPNKFEDPEKQKEWLNICDLAHDVFEVYFTTDDSSADLGKMKDNKFKFHNYFLGTMPWLPQYIKKMLFPSIMKEILLFIEASFRGIGQVYFQNNPLSGLIILVAMFVQSSRVAVHGVIALVAGNLAGVFMGFDKSFLSCGLFGYNSFLVGLALATFHSPEMHTGYSWTIAIGSIIFAYFSSVLFVMLGKLLGPYKTPPFTFPFNIATLIFLLAMSDLKTGGNLVVVDAGSISARAFFAGTVRGVGQVFLANNIISGVLVLIAIAICSRISAFAAFIGSAVGTAVAALSGSSADAIENGMFGFNPSLTFTAMLMFYVPSIGSFSVGIIASIVTVFVQLALATAMGPSGLPFMTLPFCFAALSYIAIQGTTSNVISVPLSSMTTPEDHLKRVSRLSEGFQLLYGAIKSTSYTGKRRRSWGVINRKSTRMTSILQEYEMEVNGEKGEGCIKSMFRCFDAIIGCSDGEIRSSQSFRMSFAMNNPVFKDEEKDSYARIFNHIDSGDEYTINTDQFKEFLMSVGLNDEVGLDFARKSFGLMDLDGSGDIDLDEFIAFSKISRHMPAIRRLIVKFFDFVDMNGDRSVEISELDSARSYLGLPALSEEDHKRLQHFCNEDEELEFDVIVNFVTIFKLKSIIRAYQEKRSDGNSLDKSMHSALSN